LSFGITYFKEKDLISIINRGLSKTVICIYVLINRIGNNCKMPIKGNDDNLMT